MNIFNDSSAYVTSNENFSNLTAQNAIIENAAIDNLNVDQSAVFNNLAINGFNNGDILISQNSGIIDGLTISANNDVLCSNGVNPEWRNDLTINDLTCNTLSIPTTAQGDLLIMNSAQQATRLIIGPSGTFLISNGTDPQWEPLPNPLIVGSEQVNGILELTQYSNCNIFTDNTGFLINERAKFTQGGTQGFTTIPTQFYGSATWYMTNNAWYKLKVLLVSSNSNSFFGNVKINATPIAYFHYIGPQTNTISIDQIYQHNGSTGLQGIALEAQTSSGISSISYYQIYLERISEPVIVL